MVLLVLQLWQGVEAMNQGGGMDADDLASMFFGGGGGRRRRGPAKTKDVVKPFPVKLEDIYNGKTKRFAITRNVLCKGCSGSGAKDGKAEVVRQCSCQPRAHTIQHTVPQQLANVYTCMHD